jgi:hypothetical protein
MKAATNNTGRGQRKGRGGRLKEIVTLGEGKVNGAVDTCQTLICLIVQTKQVDFV